MQEISLKKLPKIIWWQLRWVGCQLSGLNVTTPVVSSTHLRVFTTAHTNINNTIIELAQVPKRKLYKFYWSWIKIIMPLIWVFLLNCYPKILLLFEILRTQIKSLEWRKIIQRKKRVILGIQDVTKNAVKNCVYFTSNIISIDNVFVLHEIHMMTSSN